MCVCVNSRIHVIMFCIWSKRYLLDIDYYCGESTGWMMIKDRGKMKQLVAMPGIPFIN